jgi:predicted DNA binding CopG/RHH family protein
MKMAKKISTTQNWEEYYDQADILNELLEEPVHFSLDDQLQKEILSGKRARRLKNVTIKIDPLQVQMIRKMAVTKSMPYQTLIRHWLSEKLKSELNLTR